MPLVSRKTVGGSTLLCWRITECEEELRAFTTEDDRRSALAFASPGRRLERLAWRAALRTLIPVGEVGYTETGAPYLYGESRHIGVAHTGGLAVVMVSGSVCGVDVECADRDFGVAAARFISPLESKLADSVRPEFSAAVWCMKEAMYKYSGRRELDLLRDLKITACDLTAGKITGEITGCTVHGVVERFGEFLIVYILPPLDFSV